MMRRPSLLVQAAQFVADRKKFKKHSKSSAQKQEQEYEDARKRGDPTYKAKDHIMVLAELIQILRKEQK